MPIDPNAPAFPREGYIPGATQQGLTIRQHFALELAKAMIIRFDRDPRCGTYSEMAIELAPDAADHLIAALNRDERMHTETESEEQS